MLRREGSGAGQGGAGEDGAGQDGAGRGGSGAGRDRRLAVGQAADGRTGAGNPSRPRQHLRMSSLTGAFRNVHKLKLQPPPSTSLSLTQPVL